LDGKQEKVKSIEWRQDKNGNCMVTKVEWYEDENKHKQRVITFSGDDGNNYVRNISTYDGGTESSSVDYWPNGHKQMETLTNIDVYVGNMKYGTGLLPITLHPTIVYYENGQKEAMYVKDPRDVNYNSYAPYTSGGGYKASFWDEDGKPLDPDTYLKRRFGKTWAHDYLTP